MGKPLFESKPCGRCGGSGQHSYCEMHGTTCFKCGGAGVTLTKRGSVAAAYLKTLRSVPMSALELGATVWCDSFFTKPFWGTYTGAEPSSSCAITKAADGSEIRTYYVAHNFIGPKRGQVYGVCTFPDSSELVRVRRDDATERAMIAQALAYQSTLTLSGKVSARPTSEPKARAPRVDVHKPSAIAPADYEFAGYEYLGPECAPETAIANRERIRAHMARTGGTYSAHVHGGNCHVCGSVNAIYTALFFHKPTCTYIRTGLDCCEKLDSSENGAEFRRETRAALEQVAGIRKAQALCAERACVDAFNAYDTARKNALGREPTRAEATAIDILGKLVQYGSISDKTWAYLATLSDQIARAPAIAAEREQANASAAPFPVTSERVTVQGRVVSIKRPKHAYDGAPQMLVIHESGWKAYGTLPSALDAVERGALVEFSAVLKPSANDSKFGYFSRPTKARVVSDTSTQGV